MTGRRGRAASLAAQSPTALRNRPSKPPEQVIKEKLKLFEAQFAHAGSAH
jgi:hypothetical protein